jgi:hypothetical protein
MTQHKLKAIILYNLLFRNTTLHAVHILCCRSRMGDIMARVEGSIPSRGDFEYLHYTRVLFFSVKEEEEGLQGVFKRLRRNGHQLEKGLQMAQRGPSLK